MAHDLRYVSVSKQECTICLNLFGEPSSYNETSKTLAVLNNCAHIFHVECLRKLSAFSCPNCRKSFKKGNGYTVLKFLDFSVVDFKGVNSHIFRSDLGNDANNESNINLREKTSDLERINFKNLQKQYFQEKKLNESKIFKIENESKNLENSLLASQNEIKLLKRQSKLLEKTLQTNLAIMDDTKNKNLEEYQKILNLLETERLISKSLRIDLEKSTKLHLIAENNLRDSLNQEKRNNLNLMIELNAYKSNIKSLKEEQIKLQNKEREYLLKSNYCSRENFASRLEICQSQCSPTSESAERYNKEKFLELKKENLNLKNKFEIMQKSYEKVTSNTFNANCEIRGGNIPRQNLTAPLESEDFLLVPGSFKSNKPGIVSRIKSKKELSRKTPYLKSTPLPLKTFFTNTERKFKRS